MKTQKPPIVLSLKQYTDDYVTSLTDAILDGLNEQTSVIGEENIRLLAMTIVTSLVASIMYKELIADAKSNAKNKRTREEKVIKRFSEGKMLMQSAVAAGFEAAMEKFSGKPFEYYCQILPVPSNPSTKVN